MMKLFMTSASMITQRCFAKRLVNSLAYTPPNLVDLPYRWCMMAPQLQEEITEYLVWKMEDSWKLLTPDELKASYYISYGSWGPRGKSALKLTPAILIWKALFSTILFTALGVSLFNLQRDKKMDRALRELEENALE